MLFGKTKNIEKVWDKICKHEGEAFYTITNIEYNYVVKDNWSLYASDTDSQRIGSISSER